MQRSKITKNAYILGYECFVIILCLAFNIFMALDLWYLNMAYNFDVLFVIV